MILGSVQICGEKLSTVEVKDIRESLESDNVRLLALRECKVSDKNFKSLMKSVGISRSLLQLNLNLGMVNLQRAETLSRAVHKNRSLTALFLHGSPLGDRGVALVCKMIASHPHIVSLDLGESLMTDTAIPYIADLLPPNGAKKGLEDLILSGNTRVSAVGWSKLFVGLSASCCLKTLSLDYNKLGDYGAGCISVALPVMRKLQVLDLEGAGITQYGAEILLYTVKSYPVSLKQVILSENAIRKDTIRDIDECLRSEAGSTMGSRINLLAFDDGASEDSMSTASASSTSFAPGTIISKDTMLRLQETSGEEDESSDGTIDASDDSGDDSELEAIEMNKPVANASNGKNTETLSTGDGMEEAYAAALNSKLSTT